ncbi:hypothetical protein [Terasakiella sp.]|uniref:hypothetical protein n=1 Tax=Terasakiella sp. TaxID=2034861 RepID=UPI003AA7C800
MQDQVVTIEELEKGRLQCARLIAAGHEAALIHFQRLEEEIKARQGQSSALERALALAAAQ